MSESERRAAYARAYEQASGCVIASPAGIEAVLALFVRELARPATLEVAVRAVPAWVPTRVVVQSALEAAVLHAAQAVPDVAPGDPF